MVAVDTNILVYAHREDSQWYDKSDRIIKELAEGNKSWFIPWPCIHEFFGIVTNKNIFKTPTPIKDAITQIDSWLNAPNLKLIGELNLDYLTYLKNILIQSRITGAKVHDARIAAICIHHGIKKLYSADRDFSAFPDLKVENPLI